MAVKFIALSLTFLLILSGCGSVFTGGDEIILSTGITEFTEEIELQDDILSTEEAPVVFHTLENQITYLRTCQDYKSYQWMVNLEAEDVAYIEFVNLDDLHTPYKKYEGESIEEVINLFHNNGCISYEDSASWTGYYLSEFHIVMKDGTAHSVCAVDSMTTVIDGAAFQTMPFWHSERWPRTGDSPLPDGWEAMTESRNYQLIEEEVSFLGTWYDRTSRESLDHQYDTDILMGSDSRNYPIGRGSVNLSAHKSTATGVTLDAYWTGTFRGGKLMLKPEFWIEQWYDDPERGYGSYIPLEYGRFTDEYTAENTAENAVQWRVLWGTRVGTLEPGHYRIGMTFYENINGVAQNETVCYAKFSVD